MFDSGLWIQFYKFNMFDFILNQIFLRSYVLSYISHQISILSILTFRGVWNLDLQKDSIDLLFCSQSLM